MNPNAKLLVCLYSDANFLSVNILEYLLSNNCLVNIVSDDIKKWNELTTNISAKKRFAICKVGDANKDQIYNYVIFCTGFIDRSEIEKEYKKFLSAIQVNSQKVIVLLPLETYKDNLSLIEISESTAVIYLGDLLGPRMDLDSNLLVNSIINEIVNERTMSVSVGEVFFPMFVPEVTKLIVKWMFAFGPYGKETFLLGQETSSSLFWQANQKLVGGIKLQYSNKTNPRTQPKIKEVQRISSDLNFSLTETYRWIGSNFKKLSTRKVERKIISKPKKNSYHVSTKTKKIVLTTLIILMFPLFSLATSFGFLFLSARQLMSANNKSVKTTMAIAQTFAVIGSNESKVLSYIPLIGMLYKETEFLSNVAEKSLNVIEDGTVVARDLSSLLNSALGKTPYDPAALLSGTKPQMQSVYSDILDIHNMTTSGAERGIASAKIMLSRLDFNKYENMALQGIVLVDKIPEILGNTQSKTYLVLFQNNMELRPTGGFIGSYGLLTFNSGRLSDFGVSDVYSADGQLKGHVEPPAPIKIHLGEENWWLRDSNWDPDFPTSAKRAEWFLDKEIDKQVDGVISIDLAPIREILKITGPIFLPDYNLKIDSDNLYEETQSEAQDNFFPGAHNKASFLTALSRSLLGELEGVSYKQKVSTLLSFYKNLEERHIQLFLHEGESQNSISLLGWDGSVSSKECGDGCYSDMLGVVEANVGFNKANYFIKRNATLEVKLYPEKIVRKFNFILTDSANPGLGISGRYVSYVRFLVPGDSTDLIIKNISGQNSESLTTDVVDIKGRKEIGVLVEVLPGQKKELSFEWTSNFEKNQPLSYGLYLRKQAGIDGYPIEINLDTQNQSLTADSRFTLTKDGIYTYNTTLSKDLFATFSQR